MASVIQGSSGGSGMIVHPASVQGGWVVANTDLATADSAANLLKPQLVSRAAVRWIEVPQSATRCIVRGRNLATLSAVTTSPVVRVIGARGTPDRTSTTTPWSAGPAAGGTNQGVFELLATAQTLTMATTGNVEDDTNEYTTTTDLIDLKGCSWIAVLVETAASVTNSATNEALVAFVN